MLGKAGISMIVKFEVPGKPVPQQRPRVMRGGWAFDPAKCVKAKKAVRMIALAHANKMRWKASNSRFGVTLMFFGAHPLSDVDNLAKLILDALKGIFWIDDRQIDEIHAHKEKEDKGKEKTVVAVYTLDYDDQAVGGTE
jgi:Holliday junction resolvase RusA-like endonuclease